MELLDTLLGKCFFCGNEGHAGLGILLRGRFICGTCERNMVNAGCDSVIYRFYVNGLKKIWRCTME